MKGIVVSALIALVVLIAGTGEAAKTSPTISECHCDIQCGSMKFENVRVQEFESNSLRPVPKIVIYDHYGVDQVGVCTGSYAIRYTLCPIR